MLLPNEVKPFLLHEDEDVRDLAADYFHDSWSRDPDIAHLLLDAAERYGVARSVHAIGACQQVAIDEAALDRIVRLLSQFPATDASFLLAELIDVAPVEFVSRRESAIAAIKGHFVDVLPRLRRRQELAHQTPRKLWQDLLDFAAAAESNQYANELDHAYLDDLIEALGRYSEPSPAALCEQLGMPDEVGSWLEIFLIKLVGVRRIREAIPLLTERFKIDTDFMLERCNDALAQIGDPEAVRLVRAEFLAQNWNYRLYSNGVFSHIKHPDSEAAALALLEEETDVGIRTNLCLNLCELISAPAIDVVRKEIEQGYDRMIVSLEEMLLCVATMTGVVLPEADEWRAERAEAKRRQAEQSAQFEELGRRWAAAKQQGKGAAAASAPNRLAADDPPLWEPSGERLEPIRYDKPRVGRNDPCPCKSGKKFKNCCGRKQG